KGFVLGFTCIIAGNGLRRMKFLRIEDSLPISKLTFNLFLPALLFAKTSKASLSLSLWPVAVASFVTHGVLVAVVLVATRYLVESKSFRGHSCLCLLGANVAFTYPLVLSSPVLAETLFPKMIVWDTFGNAFVVFVVDYVIAMNYAPNKEATADEVQGIVPLQGVPVEESFGLELADDVSIGTVIWSDGNGNVGESRKRANSRYADVLGNESEDEQLDATAPDPSQFVDEDDPEKPGPSTLGRRSTQMQLSPTGVLAEALAHSGGHELRSSNGRQELLGGIRKVATNLPFLGQMLGLIANLSGLRMPGPLDDLIESLSQPYSALLFILLGLNLRWAIIRPKWAVIAKLLLARSLLMGSAALLLQLLPILPDEHSRHAVLLALVCPVARVTMSYVLDFGYNSSLHAAFMATSNVFAFSLLFALIVTFTS
ncbi:unnamed protein product, partial [Polarella glacialis]